MPEFFKRNFLLRNLLSNLMFYVDGGDGGGAPAPAPAPAPAGAPAPAPTPAPAARNPLLEGSIDEVPESFREHVRELRRENASLRARTKQQDEADAQSKIDDAVRKAVETERASTKELLKAERAASDKRTIASEVRLAAQKLGIVDLDGLKLADTSKLSVDPETGEVAGVMELMTQFKEGRPYLFKDVPVDSSHTGVPPKAKPADKFNAKTATPEEMAAKAKELGITLKKH